MEPRSEGHAADPEGAWLEPSEGEPLPVQGNLSFGRTAENQVMLPDNRISRRHAILHAQGDDGYWIADLGSRNGTYVNERRVAMPTRLHDGDRIRMGGFEYRFRCPSASDAPREHQPTLMTLVEIQVSPCWLLVADIAGSTARSQSAPEASPHQDLSRWFLQCRRWVEASHGTVNKFLGDGFLAFWRCDRVPGEAMEPFLQLLKDQQARQSPPFRWILHRGEVHFGGAATLGEDSLSGLAVNVAFRMEKLAGKLALSRLLSASAAEHLPSHIPRAPAGSHELAGVSGRHEFFSAWPDAPSGIPSAG